MIWTNKHQLIAGFESCEREIKNLRDDNRIMSGQLNIVDRLLNAIESHQPNHYGKCSDGSDDVLCNIMQTKKALEDEIATESK